MFQYFRTILYVYFRRILGRGINLRGGKSLCSPLSKKFLCVDVCAERKEWTCMEQILA